ncbi:ADP-ribosylation factor-like protein 13B [Anguilla anguilla]|uniref:ADP-ribosylation factor-like protein 13B n=1 Tax=Anguilla anguilla TaxID=7936 RepID=UPI0015ADC133|nr:ADP-ribosylation factor-like protein 13B [Anguilla anguilla]
MENCWKFLRKRRRPERKVTLAILGLDNAGKTSTIRSIQGENPEDVWPTVGFCPVSLKQGQYDMSIFDLGGGEHMRDMWKHYFAECHGVMFVVDSSDGQRMKETEDTLAKVLSHPLIKGKPLLLLANKQDREEALREADIVDHLSLETLVKQNKCRCKVVPYSAVMTVGKKAIEDGLEWLLESVGTAYGIINGRVQKDTAKQREQEEKFRRERAERVRKVREERERRQQEEAEREEAKTAELDQGEKGTMGNPVQPFGDFIPEMKTMKKTESKKDSDQADHSPKRKRKLSFWRKNNRVAPLTPDGPAKTHGCLKSWFGWLKHNVVTPQ